MFCFIEVFIALPFQLKENQTLRRRPRPRATASKSGTRAVSRVQRTWRPHVRNQRQRPRFYMRSQRRRQRRRIRQSCWRRSSTSYRT